MNEKIKLLKKGQRATIIAGSTTLFFALAKGTVGLISGSVVLLADAVHSGADAFSTFFAWLGLRIAQKKPSEKFPYGYYKAENITSLLISGLILFAGYEIVKESISKIFIEYQLNVPLLAISVAILDALVMFFIGSYEVKIGKEVDSQSLIADGRESRMHLLSSSIVLIGLLSNFFGFLSLEGIAGILISLVVLRMGVLTAKDSIFALMDVSPSKEIDKKIKKIIISISGVEDVKHIKLRSSGPFIFGEGHVKIRKYVNVNRAHEIADNIEEKIKKNVKQIESFTIHIEPFKSTKQKIVIPIKENKGLNSVVMNHFGRADNFIFINIDNKKIKSFYVKKNPFKEKKVRAGLSAVDFVIKEKIDLLITMEMGGISFHTLRDNLVDLYKTKGRTVKNVLENLIKNKLEKLEKPTRRKE